MSFPMAINVVWSFLAKVLKPRLIQQMVTICTWTLTRLSPSQEDVMTIDKIALLLAQCQSMSILLNERLGDENPWSRVIWKDLDETELAQSKRLMHELLYAPPSKR